jgi:CRP/FNR family transcriptional regulator, cyclic AMP receptor protein
MTAVTPDTVVERFPGLAEAGETLASLLEVAQLHEADAGEALVAEGTPSAELFIVLEGTLDITTEGRRMTTVGPGAYFGEVSLFDPGPAGATIVTDQGCSVLRLGRDQLEQLRQADPALAATLVGDVLRSLVARTRAAAAMLDDSPAAAR